MRCLFCDELHESETKLRNHYNAMHDIAGNLVTCVCGELCGWREGLMAISSHMAKCSDCPIHYALIRSGAEVKFHE